MHIQHENIHVIGWPDKAEAAASTDIAKSMRARVDGEYVVFELVLHSGQTTTAKLQIAALEALDIGYFLAFLDAHVANISQS